MIIGFLLLFVVVSQQGNAWYRHGSQVHPSQERQFRENFDFPGHATGTDVDHHLTRFSGWQFEVADASHPHPGLSLQTQQRPAGQRFR